MKIQKIVLRNFSLVKTAMDTNEVSIDFTDANNKVCLIIGPNGSGKTTLLSLFNPFAGLGNLDVRDGNELILENKDGYKEIHFLNDDDYYIIKHFYYHHEGKSHSVKSYIMKNDIELNENGNVTSFKEYVKAELGIEPDYLKLIRLGSNVTSLIKLSETERKTFMGKLLDEIGVFMMYYKKLTNDVRQLKDMISHVVDKLNRLGIEDKKSVKEEIKQLNLLLDEEQSKYTTISGKISVYNHDIDNIDEPETLKDRLTSSLRKLSKMQKILDNKDSLESTDPIYYKNEIDSITKELNRYQNELDTADILIKNHLSTLNQLEEQKRILYVQYQKEQESDKELNKMNDELCKLRVLMNEYEDNLNHFSPEYTKKELEDFIVFLKNTQQTLDRTYGFGKPVIKKIIALLRENRNVVNYIDSHSMNLSSNDDEQSLFLHSLSQRFDFSKDCVSDCQNQSCQARQLWIQVGNLLRNRETSEKEKEDITFYNAMEYAYNNIKLVLTSFSEFKDTIKKLPDDLKDSFKIESIYKAIESCDNIYDEKKFNDLLSITTEYDNYINLIRRCTELEKDINRFSQLSNITYIHDQIDYVENQLRETREKISNLKIRCSELNEMIRDNNRTLESMEELFETFEKYDFINSEASKLQEEYNLYIRNVDLIQSSQLELHRCKMNIDSLTQKIQDRKSALDQYISLKTELKTYNESYDEMVLIKNSQSSKEGMSMYYIKDYLGNASQITNELLEIAYDGEKYIDEFKISPTEFQIPYYNKGKMIKDVKYASQGELSFLSVALSFALASQALRNYNIMLLDEIDGPLDLNNREKFIQILENQIERIRSEQNFLISHNDMFSSYPVDIIDLNFSGINEDREKYKLANFITVVRK